MQATEAEASAHPRSKKRKKTPTKSEQKERDGTSAGGKEDPGEQIAGGVRVQGGSGGGLGGLEGGLGAEEEMELMVAPEAKRLKTSPFCGRTSGLVSGLGFRV
jgi:hypothetical protein